MTGSHQPREITLSNEPALHKLAWAIAASQGQFALLLARCNYTSLRDSMKERLHQLCPSEIRELTLKPSDRRFYTKIREELTDEQPVALMVSGLESVSNLDQMLTAMNQVREEFRKNLPLPLVLWVNDEALKKLIRLAPDFHNWGTLTEFQSNLSRLTDALKQRKDKLFNAVLEADGKQFAPNAVIFGPSYQHEMKSALADLQSLGQALEPDLQATLEFVLGREAHVQNKIDAALALYQKSLDFWRQSPNQLERQGILLFHIGLCHLRLAEQHNSARRVYLENARRYFQRALDRFEQTQWPELVAKFINQLGETLQHLEAWDDLSRLAQKSLTLQKNRQDPIQLAQAHGFLAEVALQKTRSEEANKAAQKALDILKRVSENQEHYQNLYLLLIARSFEQQHQFEQAIANLERARKIGSQGKPQLYIRVLNLLRTLYFHQKRYLEAFQVKQERRSIEQQYGLRAFVGAGRLKPQRRAKSTLVPVEQPVPIAQEIAASSRREDVDRLISRIAEPRHKLTVIYGQSGVGKSSLVEAGLVPTLKQQQVIGARDVVPILLRTYSHWVQDLGEQLVTVLEKTAVDLELPPKCNLLDVILEQLKQSEPSNLLSVLIFDQFEEFFFVCERPTERQRFFEFFRDCLDIPCVKVILSMREDYLHHLLRQGGRKRIQLNAINNNILDKDILYYLGNFSAEDAKSIILRLTERARFSLADDLVDELVQDLTDELGEVQPIELQIVGEQLQAENIRTLAQYRERGPKEQLVQRYLETVMADCGAENHQLAELILYFLTDENHTRPLKTRVELVTDLRLVTKDLSAEADKLDLVLNILVNSGLVLQLPEMPTARYQLVHDYLAVFIRQQEEPKLKELAAELEKEREQRKHSEEQLNQFKALVAALEQEKEQRQRSEEKRQRSENQLNRVLKQRLRISIATGFVLVILTTLTGTFALRSDLQRKKSAINEIETTIANSELKWVFNQDFNVLVAGLKALEKLRQIRSPIIPQFKPKQGSKIEDLRQKAEKVLQKSVYRVSEHNQLEGHEDTVYSVDFSPDGQFIATASRDKTVKLWSQNGREHLTIKGHTDKVRSVSFSPNGQTLATASEDNTVKLWNLEGEELHTLIGHDDKVHSVSFSPDGQTIATASEDGTAKLWSLNGQEIQTLAGHSEAVLEVSFSPQGQTIATASYDQTAKLWSLEGQELQTLEGHKDAVFSVSFSPDGQTIATGSKDKSAKRWSLEGQELQTLEEHNETVTSVRFSPDGQTIITASADDTVKVWGHDGQPLQTLIGHGSWVLSVDFSPDEQTLATASADHTVKLWRLNSQSILGHTALVHDVSFSPDGSTIATVSEDKTFKLWRFNTHAPADYLRSFLGHTDEVRAISFSPVAPIIATASNDQMVKLWDPDGEELQTISGHSDLVVDVSFSPDGQTLATASWDNTAKLWSQEGQELQTLSGHTNEIEAVSFSPDGQTIATASRDWTVKLWNLRGEELATLMGHKGFVTDVNFSRDGQRIATASYDDTAKLWNLEGKELATLAGHDRTVTAVAFSPDGQTLATGSWDQTIKLWDLQGQELDTLYGHTGSVMSLNFSSDGQFIASSDGRGRVILWNLDWGTDALWARGCEWVRGYLENNSQVEEGDRTLCDRIGAQE
ncbi:MAG: hypothetical protein QNJ46_18925 [Leptolyngbyaceae cyanobacterium MO_188.B28]|nr:hypothetical protein [Leptolyngbyaceae cyanobacterium MO_188.B28]